MNRSLKISIITVVRNGERFIKETIDSVLCQTYPDIEYIVIDGLSNDGTVDIIKENSSRIAYWVSEKDHGIADAFNKGFAASHGDYILYLNADDSLASPDVISNVVSEIQRESLPMMLYGDISYIERETGNFIRHVSMPYSKVDLLHGVMFPHPGLFTHRGYFEKYGIFDTSFRITMDYEWLLRGALKERVVHYPILVTYFRDGGASNVDHKKVKEETIRALLKNKLVMPGVDLYRLKTYFLVRTVIKRLLKMSGLYNFCMQRK